MTNSSTINIEKCIDDRPVGFLSVRGDHAYAWGVMHYLCGYQITSRLKRFGLRLSFTY